MSFSDTINATTINASKFYKDGEEINHSHIASGDITADNITVSNVITSNQFRGNGISLQGDCFLKRLATKELEIQGDSDNSGNILVQTGKVGIGTDNPVGNLTVKSQNRQISIIDSGDNNVSEIRAHANSNLDSKAYLQITSYALGLNTNNSDNAISIDANGQTTIYNLTSNSDDRIKHNEKEISNSLSVISKLKPKHYFKTSGLYDANHNFKLDISGNPMIIQEINWLLIKITL